MLPREEKNRKESKMPTFIILSTLTEEGWKHLKQKPDRILEVNREIEAMGIKIQKQYALLGDYDFANIVEAPNNEAVMRMSLELGSRGSVQFTTFPAWLVEEFIKSISQKKVAESVKESRKVCRRPLPTSQTEYSPVHGVVTVFPSTWSGTCRENHPIRQFAERLQLLRRSPASMRDRCPPVSTMLMSGFFLRYPERCQAMDLSHIICASQKFYEILSVMP